jgi:hypothetical protein
MIDMEKTTSFVRTQVRQDKAVRLLNPAALESTRKRVAASKLLGSGVVAPIYYTPAKDFSFSEYRLLNGAETGEGGRWGRVDHLAVHLWLTGLKKPTNSFFFSPAVIFAHDFLDLQNICATTKIGNLLLGVVLYYFFETTAGTINVM